MYTWAWFLVPDVGPEKGSNRDRPFFEGLPKIGRAQDSAVSAGIEKEAAGAAIDGDAQRAGCSMSRNM
jgi:hypothetical protein